MSSREIIITDPSYVKTSIDYGENISPDQQASPKFKSPANYVKVPITMELYEQLEKKNTEEGKSTYSYPSAENAEEMILLLDNESCAEISNTTTYIAPDSGWQYLGSHTSDSGLTCILDANPYDVTNYPDKEFHPEDLELDWLELVTTSLEGGTIDLEQFPLLKFCAAIPDGESAVAVFGRASNVCGPYSKLVLRSWTRVFSDNGNVNEYKEEETL